MKITVEELEAYLSGLYAGKVTDQGLFMKLVEEMGETAEILNKLTGRKAADAGDLKTQLGMELADVIHYAAAIAAVHGLDLNAIILDKDKRASRKYHHEINLEQFVSARRAQVQE